jgi:hypothetical protein
MSVKVAFREPESGPGAAVTAKLAETQANLETRRGMLTQEETRLAQAEVRVIGKSDRILFVSHDIDRGHGAEDLLAQDGHVRCESVQNSGRIERPSSSRTHASCANSRALRN